MTGAMHLRSQRVKQLSQPQQRAAINAGAFSGFNTGTDGLVKHPRGHTTSCVGRKPDIHQIPLAPGSTEHFERCSEQRMERIEKF